MKPPLDFIIKDHGDNFIVTAMTKQAKTWAKKNIGNELLRNERDYIVDTLVIGVLMEGMHSDNLSTYELKPIKPMPRKKKTKEDKNLEKEKELQQLWEKLQEEIKIWR